MPRQRLTTSMTGLASLLLGASMTASVVATDAPVRAAGTTRNPILLEDPTTPDAIAFFQRLVQRYRSLHRYTEEAEVEQVTEDPATDAAPIRSRTRVRAEVDDDRLTVQTSSLADRIAEVVAPGSEEVRESDLWMLPHLRLRFDEKPLESFRPATRQAFRAAEVDRVRVEDRELVRVELLSGETGSPDARFSLFVDPERMLVERVEGDEWLPGGLRHRTTVRIDAHEVHEVREASPEPPEAGADGVQPATPTDRAPAEEPDDVPVGGLGLGVSSIG